LALVNLAFESHLFWDGRENTLETMLIQPMTRPDEMGLTESQINNVLNNAHYDTLFGKAFEGQKPSFLLARRAISMYARSLVSGDSKYDNYLLGTYTPTAEELRGMRLFFTHPDPSARLRGGNCGDCHLTLTTAGSTIGFTGFKNNGLSINTNLDYGLEKTTNDPNDRGKFKIPSLRNIALSAPYMHDGRFTTLQQVLDHYNDSTLFKAQHVDPLIPAGVNARNGTSLGLTAQEKADIITFLHKSNNIIKKC
jgi:cytochrome c peroxidase